MQIFPERIKREKELLAFLNKIAVARKVGGQAYCFFRLFIR